MSLNAVDDWRAEVEIDAKFMALTPSSQKQDLAPKLVHVCQALTKVETTSPLWELQLPQMDSGTRSVDSGDECSIEGNELRQLFSHANLDMNDNDKVTDRKALRVH